MAAFNFNHGNNGQVINAGQIVQAVREDPSLALLSLGGATCSMVLRATVSAADEQPEEGMGSVYMGAMAAASVGGLATIWAAIWVADDRGSRHRIGQLLFYLAVVPFVLALGLSGTELTFNA